MTKDDMDLLKGFPLSIEQKERLLELIGNNKNGGGDDKIIFKFNKDLSILSYNNVDYTANLEENQINIIDENLPGLIKIKMLEGSHIVILINVEKDGKSAVLTSHLNDLTFVEEDNMYAVNTEFKVEGVTIFLNIISK